MNAPAPGQPCQPSETLRAGALKLPSVLMQGITHIAPAVALLVIPFIASHARLATPLAFLIGFGIILTLGLSLTQLARHLPSAGGYYTYVSRTVHPRAGFLTAWLYFLYDPTATAINLAFMGAFVEKILPACPWWLFFIAATTLITILTYRGIEISARILMILGIAEIAIVVALGATGLIAPGPGGVNLAPFDFRNAPSLGGLGMGVVFAILSFSGFESVAPLAEESVDPRRNLPRAIVGSIILMGGFFIFIYNEYYLVGTVVSLGMVLVYCAGNLGVWRLYRGEKRSEFKPLLHAVFPLFSSLAMIAAGVFSIIPLPPEPMRWAPFIVLGWLALGVLLLLYLHRTGREQWILEAGQVVYERKEPLDPGSN